jgi:RNA polymerase sigma-70 factor (ECF subfamily)
VTDPYGFLSTDCPDLRGYLLHIARRRLGGALHSRGGASDLVQTALLRAHEARDQCRAATPQQYRGWLRQILLNVIRRFRRWHHGPARDAAREVPLAAVPADILTGPAGDPSQEPDGQLGDALDRLPEEQRRAVILRAEHEMSFEQIGEALGKSADAARMTYHRALERLQTVLRGQQV